MPLANAATIRALPPQVAAALKACPRAATPHVSALRAMIYETAAETSGVGEIVETLKWGQPSYQTEKPRSGTPVRLSWDETGAMVRLLVHCQTTLINSWRERYGDTLTFVDNREVSLPTDQPLPKAPLQHCIAMALTYHQRKTSK